MVTLDMHTKINCTYDEDGWGPLMDYHIHLSIDDGMQPSVSLMSICSSDEDLDKSWTHIQKTLQKIAIYVDCHINLRRS